MSGEIYLTAQAAAKRLNISVSSLYSYVSRGLIGSKSGQGKDRKRLYLIEDIRQLEQKKQLRQQPVEGVKNALHGGMPVITSRVSRIDNGKLFYRQYDLEQLLGTVTFEQIAQLLWRGELSQTFDWRNGRILLKKLIQQSGRSVVSVDYPFMQQAQSQLLFLDMIDQQSLFKQRDNVLRMAINCLLSFCYIVTNQYPKIRLAEHLSQHWQCDQHHQIIEMALIVCADHELNASTFTGRCIASTGANLYQVVNGALSAFSGPKHGGMAKSVEYFWQQLQQSDHPQQLVAEWQARNAAVPGFGHPLYPAGDPRARYLLNLLTSFDHPECDKLQDLLTMMALQNYYPTVDLALVAAEKMLGLPQGGATILFTMGRTVGWVAHAIEQYQSDDLIRPRAAYDEI